MFFTVYYYHGGHETFEAENFDDAYKWARRTAKRTFKVISCLRRGKFEEAQS
jgi:hypothetical protein